MVGKHTFSWKCQDCGMTSRREPHRRLCDHMESSHGKAWDEQASEYRCKRLIALEELAKQAQELDMGY